MEREKFGRRRACLAEDLGRYHAHIVQLHAAHRRRHDRHRRDRPARSTQAVRGLRPGRRFRDVRRPSPVEGPPAPSQQPGRRSARGRLRRARFFRNEPAFWPAGTHAPGPWWKDSPARQRIRGSSGLRAVRQRQPHCAERRHHGGATRPLPPPERPDRRPRARRQAARPTRAASGGSPCTPTATPTTCVST